MNNNGVQFVMIAMVMVGLLSLFIAFRRTTRRVTFPPAYFNEPPPYETVGPVRKYSGAEFVRNIYDF